MDTYRISNDKKTLFIQKYHVSFKDDINTVLTFPDIHVIQLQNHFYVNGQPGCDMSKQPLNNVYGIDKKCNIIWNIKQITAKHLGIQPDEFYSAVTMLSDSLLRLFAFRCISFDIDINTLSVVYKAFTK